MSAEINTAIDLEIAHVLFVDVVGFSKLSLNEERRLFDDLTRVIRETSAFRGAENAGRLIRLPTGDGMALVFSESPVAPVQCAIEISKVLHDSAKLPLRMGIHSGPVSRVVDVNDRPNVTGSGINIAQRVMNSGDAGHILLSKRTADDLAEHQDWQSWLHPIGECEAKHGAKLDLVNFYKGEVGNPCLPAKVQEAAVRVVWRRRKNIIALGSVLGAALLILAATLMLLRNGSDRRRQSIAVLPFENLTDEKQNAHLTDAIHDGVLGNLAKVPQLKVISRTSVLQYDTASRPNLREIARQLNVSKVVEGTIQCAEGQIRATVQLIDAKTDNHIWSGKFERDMSGIFVVESELAERIADQLVSRLSPDLKAAIQTPPTSNLDAYDLYARARNLIDVAVFNTARPDNLFEAIRLLDEAVQRDPSFFLAYCQLAHAHDQLYFIGQDHTAARLQLAEAAIQALLRLRPDSGEAHLALAKHYYWGYLDYDKARLELKQAQHALPNNVWSFLLGGYVDRRQGRWDDSNREFTSALELDPRNPFVLQQMALSYQCLRDYHKAAELLDRALEVSPRDVALQLNRASIELDESAKVHPLREAAEIIVQSNPNAAGSVAESQVVVERYARDHASAARAVLNLTTDGCRVEGLPFPRSFCEGLVAREGGNVVSADLAFVRAREEVAQMLNQQPKYAEALCVLGTIDAALNRKDDAIREGRLAVELLPVTKDSINGALVVQYLAVIYAWTGEKELALDQLEIAAKLPGYLSYGQLALDPLWDPLRDEPRFKIIVASLAPATRP